MPSMYRTAVMFAIVCCLLLSAVCAAPSSAVNIGQEPINGLLVRHNGTDDSEDTDANPLAVAWFVARYGCMFAKYAAITCRFLRSGEIANGVMLTGRSDEEDLDQIDWNEVRRVVKNHGCPIIKGVAFACRLIG